MTIGYSVNPTPSDANAILVDPGTSTVSVFSNDPLSGLNTIGASTSTPKAYTVSIFMVTEAGTAIDNGIERIQFTVEMTDPCFTATIDLSSGLVPDLSPSYTLGAVADT